MNLFKTKTVLVFDRSDNFVGAITASCLAAKPLHGDVAQFDLQEAMALLNRPDMAGLTIYDRFNHRVERIYRIGTYKRAAVG